MSQWPHRKQLRSVIALSAARPAYTLGLRAATVTVLPLLIGELTGNQGLVWMAVGGWLGTLADPGGPYLYRTRMICGFALCAAMLAALGTLAESAPPAVGLITLFATVFIAALFRVRGDAQATVSLLVSIVFAISLGIPGIHTPPIAALLRASHFLAGCAFALLLSVGLWPFQPYRPARRALGECFRLLAKNLAGMQALLASGEDAEQAWYALGSSDRPLVRAALERARLALSEIRRGRQGETDRGERLIMLFELGDLLLGDASSCSEMLRHLSAREKAAAAPILGELATALSAVAVQVEDERRAQAALPASARELVEVRQHAPAPLPAACSRASSALCISAGLTSSGVQSKELIAFEPPSPRPSIRDALDPKSEALRHALRLAIATTVGGAVGLVLNEVYGLARVPWLTVTIMIVLQPQAGTTLARALQRVGGTVLGGVAAALLAPVSHHPLWYALLLFVLSVAAFALKPISYGLFAALLTPIFVLMAEQQSGANLVEARIINTVLGGAIALLFGIVLWPSWERARLPAQISNLLRSARALLESAQEGVKNDPVRARRARRELGLALANAESTFQRYLGEPHEEQKVQATMALLVGARRLMGLLITLASPEHKGAQETTGALASAAELSVVALALDDLAAAIESSAAPPPLPAELSTESLPSTPDEHAALISRIARQTALLYVLANRLLNPAPSAPPAPSAA